MDPSKRFLEYATAFEQTYADDDWSRLQPYFTEDAVYRVTGGAPLGGTWQGRTQLLTHLREIVNQLDRRFDERIVEPLGEPMAGVDSFEIRWRGTYRKKSLPDLVFEGTERVVFEGDRIKLMEDLMEEEASHRIQEYVAKHLA
jgi:hypothetical protein